MKQEAKIYVSGHSGMVGSAMVRLLKSKGYSNLLLKDIDKLDLKDKTAVERFFKSENPEYVFHFAARVGGIKANMSYPVDFLNDNLMITANLINACYKHGVKKLINLGSSCIYPRNCEQPMKEEYLLTGKLEPTNEAYALAKIAGLKLCEYYNKQYGTNFISLMPSNMYGPNDNFNPESSHVVASLIRKFVEAKNNNAVQVEIWGTGNAYREFMFVEDLAEACLYFITKYDVKDLPAFINIGVGEDIRIRDLVEVIKQEVGFSGEICWNTDMPDGMPRKLLDIACLKKFKWQAKTPLRKGIKDTILWYEKQHFGKN